MLPVRSLPYMQPGFGEFQVPEMEPYVANYSRKTALLGQGSTANYQQTRWDNPVRPGGAPNYMEYLQDDYFNREKSGNQGVFESLRWNPPVNGFMESLSDTRNFAGVKSREVSRRAEMAERDVFFETARPGRDVSSLSQTGDNYYGMVEPRRQTPIIERGIDSYKLAQLASNPFAVAFPLDFKQN